MRNPYKFLPVAALCLGLLSCEKIVDNLNVDPNNPTDASANLLLTGVELANITIHEGHTARVAGMWSGYFTGADRQYRDVQNYNISGGSFNQTWQNVFYGVVEQSRLIEERAKPVNNRLVIGITKVIKAHAVGTAASCWGDVPYSQAGNKQFPDPVFDPQAQVYSQVQALLDEAIGELSAGIGSSPGVADIHFGGKTAPWIDVAHTLKARFYLDTRNYAQAYEQASLGIKTPGNSLKAPHGTIQAVNENFYFQFQRSRAGDLTANGAYLTTVLDSTQAAYKGNAKTDERARLNFYFRYANTGGVKTNFLPNTNTPSATSVLRGIFAQDASFPLVSYEENLLILAEAGFRAKGFEEGLKHLNAYRAYLDVGGYIDASYRANNFNYESYLANDFAPGGIVNKDGIADNEALLREILLERYVTFFGQKLGFSDLRRTRGEVGRVPVKPNQGTVLPERFIYSQDEINSNANAPNPVPGVFTQTPVNQR